MWASFVPSALGLFLLNYQTLLALLSGGFSWGLAFALMMVFTLLVGAATVIAVVLLRRLRARSTKRNFCLEPLI